ncbi:MAG: tetratricopeptide repeat protein [Herpetosiphonaceae bacterium]|nr:tetratricopeptide repeat protein [Herpetosiphonaceae bacterium]
MRHVMTSRPPTTRWRSWLIAGFGPIVVFALGSDSAWLAANGFNGQILSNMAAPFYLLLLLRGLRPEQRLMALVFVPFSALGEYLFSLVFQLYTYKSGGVPFYIPFGHAILFSTGMLIVETAWVTQRRRQLRIALLGLHLGLFGGALVLLGDTLSAVLGLIFVLIMVAYRGRLLYLVMGVLVLYIELLGTALGCWRWDAAPFGLLQTTNPPVGAFVCYVIADIVVIQALTWWHWLRATRRSPQIARGTRADYAHKLALARMLHTEQPLAAAPTPTLSETHADGYGDGYSLGTLGLTYAALGDSERAITCFERTRALASERNDGYIQALAAWHIGQERLRQGNPIAARPLMQEYIDYLVSVRHAEAASYAAELAALENNPPAVSVKPSNGG